MSEVGEARCGVCRVVPSRRGQASYSTQHRQLGWGRTAKALGAEMRLGRIFSDAPNQCGGDPTRDKHLRDNNNLDVIIVHTKVEDGI